MYSEKYDKNSRLFVLIGAAVMTLATALRVIFYYDYVEYLWIMFLAPVVYLMWVFVLGIIPVVIYMLWIDEKE